MLFDYIIAFFGVLALAAGLFFYFQSQKLKTDWEKRGEEMRRKMYELAILKELGDRVGYSLNVQNIIDIITGSLHQFIEYSVVSYMLFDQENIIFKAHLEKSVSRKFINEIKDRMLKSLSALLNKDFNRGRVEEIISGAILVDEMDEPVQSFFNIPLVIADKVVGVITIAHVKSGLYKEEEMTILYKIVQQASEAVTRLEQVIEVEEEKLNAMVESMSEGVVMTDKNYRVMVINPAAKKIIGVEEKEDVSIFDFIDNLEGKFDIRGKLEESVKLDRVNTAGEILIKDRFYQIIVSPVKSKISVKGKEIIGGVALFHDITHEKELEKMREDFTSMIVHELRSPLDGIKKIIELIGDSQMEAAKKENFLKMIYTNSSDMLDLVNNLLDAAKIESGKFSILKQPENIAEIIEERVKFYETSADEEKIKILKNFDKNLPKNINFDKKRISQVLNNLISNSIKYTKTGGIITVQALFHKGGRDIMEEAKSAGLLLNLKDSLKKISGLGDSLLVVITDSGIGISEKNISQLFNKFKQVEAGGEYKGKKGTGLGLVISKGVVEAHGGTIGVESNEGIGSSFFFTLPA